DPAQLDEQVKAWFVFLARDDSAFRQMGTALSPLLQALPGELAQQLPGFRCTATIYLYFSAGAFDGAVRVVDGRDALLVGVEVASRSQQPNELRAFLAHELYHLHHRAVTGPALDAVLYGRL